jgi:hypothetical protein
VRPNDVLCWSKGPEPVAFHRLLAREQNQGPWELIELAQFVEHLKLFQDENVFTFYVARKMPKTSPAQPSAVVKGITLSSELALKARDFLLLGPEEKRKLIGEIKEDAKKQFEFGRDSALASLPESFKRMFNRIGFTKRNNKYLPVIIMNPYSIPPGNVRNLWLSSYEEVSELSIKQSFCSSNVQSKSYSC